MMANRKTVVLAAILGGLAVGIGAFGAHGLKGLLAEQGLPEYRLEIFRTGVQYQFYHALAILLVAALPDLAAAWRRAAVAAFVIGILLFSTSLYLLAIREMQPLPTALLGPATPMGGLAFIVGWVCLAVAAWKGR